MSDVFISYSRKDKVFARRVFDRLKDEAYSSWVDWIGIPYSAKWLDEIRVGINQADNFIFIISPDSLTSRVCQLEVDHALQKNKRIIPIVRRDPDIDDLQDEWTGKEWEAIVRHNWEELAKLNFIFFRKRPGFVCHYDEITREVANPECDGVDTDADDFEQSFQNLLETIRQDPKHKRQHTRYLLRAQEWDFTKRHEDNLLIGREINDAEEWLRSWGIKNVERAHKKPPLPPIEPKPLDIHRVYIRASREAETRRTQQLRNIRRASMIGSGVAVIALVFAVIASWIGARANQNANLSATQIVLANQELTHVPITLTPIGGTLQAGATQIAAIPPTLTHVAQEIKLGNNQIISLQLANSAQNAMTDPQTSQELIALLAINSLQTAYNVPADRILISALDQLAIVHRMIHDDDVRNVAFSADDKYLLSSAGHSLFLWDAETGEKIRRFTGHHTPISSIAFSADGKQVASGSWDGTIILWDVATGEKIRTLNKHIDGIGTLAFSPDGKLLASGSWDNTVILWDVATGEVVHHLAEHTLFIELVAFMPDGQTLISASSDGTMILWDVVTGEKIRHYADERYKDHLFALSADRQTLISTDWTGDIRVWDLETGVITETLNSAHTYSHAIALSPDGQSILIAKEDYILMLDRASGQVIQRLNEHNVLINEIFFSHDGRRIVSGSYDRTMILWDVNSISNRITDEYSFAEAQFSPDDRQIIANNYIGVLNVWDIETQSIIQTYEYPDTGFISIAYSPDGRMLAGGTMEGLVIVWDSETGAEINRFKPRGDSINSIQFSADGRYLLTGAQVIQLWDVQTGANVRVFTGHSAPILQLVFSPDGQSILSGSMDQLIMLWNTQRGTRVRTFVEHSSSIEALDISPDGRYFVSGAWDDLVILWDMATGEQVRTLTTDISINSLKFSPDGRYVLGGALDGLAYLWDVETGALVRTMTGHTEAIRSVDFSSDGNYFLTSSNDKTIRIWHTDYHALIDYACHRLTRNLSSRELITYGVQADELICPDIEFIPITDFIFDDVEIELPSYSPFISRMRE